MKQPGRYIPLFLVMLLCLILSGGSRLVSQGETSELSAQSLGVSYAFEACCMPSDTAVQETVPPERRISVTLGASAVQILRPEPIAALASGRDSNGNVLSDRGYMRSVYRCFAPENGFG